MPNFLGITRRVCASHVGGTRLWTGIRTTKERKIVAERHKYYRDRIGQIWERWARIAWYREELRRTLEMIRDDERLRCAESSFVADVRSWYACVIGSAAYAELHATNGASMRELLEDAVSNFDDFQAACAYPMALPDAGAAATLLATLVKNVAPVAEWFKVEHLLLAGTSASLTYDTLDAVVTAMEAVVLTCQRAITGGASPSLLPTEQFDWYDVFMRPWRPRDEHEEPTFEDVSPSASTREVAIFPWLRLSEPISALGVAILPRSVALGEVAEDELALRSRTNYFYDEYRQRLEPSVAILPDSDLALARTRVERAAHGILFAASALNAPGSYSYVNATLLEFFYQRLGGTAEFVARRVRRRYGSRLGGSHTALLRAQRPDWAGSHLAVDAELLDALSRIDAIDQEDTVFEALRWYYVASTDADSIPPDIDRVHLRTAVERLLRQPTDDQSPRTGEQVKRVGTLTSRFVTWQCDEVKGDARNHHQQALWVLIGDRNVSVHGAGDKRAPYPFELKAIPPDWIFDRLFISLGIAKMIDLGFLPDSPRWRGFIEAFELWLAGAGDDFGLLWSGRTITLAGRAYDSKARAPLQVRSELLDAAFVYVGRKREKQSRKDDLRKEADE
jgi:hypothetical protein